MQAITIPANTVVDIRNSNSTTRFRAKRLNLPLVLTAEDYLYQTDSYLIFSKKGISYRIFKRTAVPVPHVAITPPVGQHHYTNKDAESQMTDDFVLGSIPASFTLLSKRAGTTEDFVRVRLSHPLQITRKHYRGLTRTGKQYLFEIDGLLWIVYKATAETHLPKIKSI